MKESYFLYYGGEKRGPFPGDQVRSMWASGAIAENAVYRLEGGEEWKPISGLVAAVPSPAPAVEKAPEKPAERPAGDAADVVEKAWRPAWPEKPKAPGEPAGVTYPWMKRIPVAPAGKAGGSDPGKKARWIALAGAALILAVLVPWLVGKITRRPVLEKRIETPSPASSGPVASSPVPTAMLTTPEPSPAATPVPSTPPAAVTPTVAPAATVAVKPVAKPAVHADFSETVKVVESDAGFAYELPKDWFVQQVPGWKTRAAFGAIRDGNPCNITYEIFGSRRSLNDVETALLKKIRLRPEADGLTNVEVIATPGRFETASGEKAARFVITSVRRDGKSVRQIHYLFARKDGRKVEMICNAVERGEDYDAVFDAIMKTFRVTK